MSRRRRDHRWPMAGLLAAQIGLFHAAQVEAQQRRPAVTAAPKGRGSIEVTVVEIAGTQAYLRPGEAAGIHRGADVVINRRTYTVVQTTDSFAVIEVGKDPPRELDAGRASIVAAEADQAVELPKPRPLSTWQHAWIAQPDPASLQRPRFVPLGSQVAHDRRWDLTLTAAGGALVPLGQRGSTLARAELDARVHAEPFAAPLALDLDVSLQRWFAMNLDDRAGAQARPSLFVRELLASYAPPAFFGGVGRMRYAASTLGTLDGARVSSALGGGLSIGAFGGFLPDPVSGAFSAEAQRFGVEARYARPDASLRPEAAVVVHGSTFQGSIDERRVSGVFGLYPGTSRLSGFFELSAFEANNPWHAQSLELTAAGLDGSARAGVVQVGAHFDLRKPERSRWLGAALPLSWLCRTVPAATGASSADACAPTTSTRAYGAVDAGLVFDRASLLVGANTATDLTDSTAPSTSGAFATGRILRLLGSGRLEASASYSRATYVDMWGGSIGPGVALFADALDISVYVRRTLMQYRSFSTKLLQHAAGGSIVLLPMSTLVFALQGEAMVGDDIPALLVFGTVSWHPNLR